MDVDRPEHLWRMSARPSRSYLCPYCAKAFGDDEKAFYAHEASRACRRTKAEREKAIAQTVDDYILMERKARAWDDLRAQLFPSEARVLALMDALVHPAQDSSTC